MLASSILISIPQAIRIIRKFSTDCLDGSVTLQQLRILVLIDEGFGLTKIADTLHISLPAVSKMVSGLENKNFIIRKAGKDKRSQLLKLSSEGNKILKFVKKHVEKKLMTGISELDSSEQKKLQEGLLVLNKLMALVKED